MKTVYYCQKPITHSYGPKKPPEVLIEPGTFWIHKDMGTKSINGSKYLGLSNFFEIAIDSNA